MTIGKVSFRKVFLAFAILLPTGLVDWSGVALAQCTNCTFYGTNAGAGSTGIFESGFGVNVLASGSDAGDGNTGVGYETLNSNTAGNLNTAVGVEALFANTTGGGNTAIGFQALIDNVGDGNTAVGSGALFSNTSGSLNLAIGVTALGNNTTANSNVAVGIDALENNTTGNGNTGTGYRALFNNSTGGGNIAMGSGAGTNLTTGSNNIDIGNLGVAGESNTIRIGDQSQQTTTFIAGIVNNPLSKSGAQEVLIDNQGLLGVKVSSARYKRDIRDLGDASDRLLKLRPVSFRYKQDPDGSVEYGLIAEEVEGVYPELVTHDRRGEIEGVRYDLISPLLLNEVQKQEHWSASQQREIASLHEELEKKDAQIGALQREVDQLKGEEARIDARFEERMKVLERNVRISGPQHVASALLTRPHRASSHGG